MKKEVSDFRAQLLETYKKHLTLIDAIPTYKPQPEQEIKPQPVKQTEEPPVAEEPTMELPADFHVTIANFDDDPDISPQESFSHGDDGLNIPTDVFTPGK